MAKGDRTVVLDSFKINQFKNCRRQYQLANIEHIDGIEHNLAIWIHQQYQQKVYQIYQTGDFIRTGNLSDILAEAFLKYIYPQLDNPLSINCYFKERLGYGVYLQGNIDILQEDSIVECKTTSRYIDDVYEQKLLFLNTQAANYKVATRSTKKIKYVVLVKPTIRQTRKETFAEYTKRCRAWYCKDTKRKVKIVDIQPTIEQLEEQRQQIITIAREIQRGIYYRNERACAILTCPYIRICQMYP